MIKILQIKFRWDMCAELMPILRFFVHASDDSNTTELYQH
jgi:hypothetical protein